MAEKDDKAPKGEKQQKQKRPPKGGGAEHAGAQAKGKAKPAPVERPPEPKVPPRLRVRYENEVMPLLMRELKIDNRWRVPRLEKIVINLGLGEARENVKLLDAAVEEMATLAGQKPVITRARKAISNFKLRKGMPIGAMLTLRRERMWEFFDRLVNVALPRVRDFRGVSDKAFDGRGNYSLGIREHTIFPELSLEKVELVKGLTISIVTTARSDFEGMMLLRALGMPFRGAGGERAGVAVHGASGDGAPGASAAPAQG
jgi:large subunit ribosomal protein L5